MDASYKIQRGIHVHLIQFFMCPEFWVHIKIGCFDFFTFTDISPGLFVTGRTHCPLGNVCGLIVQNIPAETNTASMLYRLRRASSDSQSPPCSSATDLAVRRLHAMTGYLKISPF